MLKDSEKATFIMPPLVKVGELPSLFEGGGRAYRFRTCPIGGNLHKGDLYAQAISDYLDLYQTVIVLK